MEMDTYILADTNTELFLRKNKPDDPKATVIIVHGLGEHLQRYNHFVSELANNNFIVYRYDARGHGKSTGKRGDLKSFKDYLNDLDTVINLAKKEHPNLKLFLFGHSMGGLIATSYASTYVDKIDYLILSGAANKTPDNARMLKLLPYRLMPKIMYKNDLSEGLTSSKEVNEAYRNDPLVLKKISLRLLGNTFIKGVKYVNDNIGNINVGTLIMHGEEDPIVDKSAAYFTYENLTLKDKELKIYDDLKHEILNENEKGKVIKDIIKWIKVRL